MKNTVVKHFESEKWFICLSNVERFMLKYGLELVNLQIKKENGRYVADLEYGLGIRND